METQRELAVEQIFLNRQHYGPDKDTLTGTITFSGSAGKIEIRIAGDKGGTILAAVAHELVTAAHEAAGILLEDIHRQAALSSSASRQALPGVPEVAE